MSIVYGPKLEKHYFVHAQQSQCVALTCKINIINFYTVKLISDLYKRITSRYTKK